MENGTPKRQQQEPQRAGSIRPRTWPSHGLPRPVRKGAVLALVGLSLLILVGFVGLAVDVTYWYFERATLQQAADAGSLAGMLEYDNEYVSQAKKFCTFNSVAASDVETVLKIAPTANNKGRIAVVVKRQVGTFFLQVFGISSITIRARAVAEGTGNSDTVTLNNGFPPGTALDYALFSASTTQGLAVDGSRQEIHGSAHSNEDFSIAGSNHIHDGNHTAVGGFSVNNKTHTFENPAVNNPIGGQAVVPMLDVIKQDVLDYPFTKVFPAGTTFGPGALGDGIYFIDGDVQISGAQNAKAAIVATGQIHVSGTKVTYGGGAEFAFVSLATSGRGIQVSGSNSTFSGYFYAPDSYINYSGHDILINGGVAADNHANISGTNIVINYGLPEAGRVPFFTRTSVQNHIHLVE